MDNIDEHEDVNSLRDKLSDVQDKWLESDEENTRLRKENLELQDQITFLNKQLDQSKFQEQRLRRASKKKSDKNLVNKTRVGREVVVCQTKLSKAEEELELLRNRVCDLESSNSDKTHTFDTEGYFQKLYKETLGLLQEERDRRHQEFIELNTKLQNLKEQLAKQERSNEDLRITFDICKESLIQEYQKLLEDKSQNQEIPE